MLMTGTNSQMCSIIQLYHPLPFAMITYRTILLLKIFRERSSCFNGFLQEFKFFFCGTCAFPVTAGSAPAPLTSAGGS